MNLKKMLKDFSKKFGNCRRDFLLYFQIAARISKVITDKNPKKSKKYFRNTKKM